MIPRLVLVAVLTGLALAPCPAADRPQPKPEPRKPKPTRAEDVLAALRMPVRYEKDPRETPLLEVLADMGSRFELRFVVNQAAFKAVGEPEINERKPGVAATSLEDVPLGRYLNLVLGPLGATYLVRSTYVEVVPVEFAAKEAKVKLSREEDEPSRLPYPLVSAIYKEKPLNEAVADLAELYDLTVVVAPQSGDNRTGFVNARLLNVPADKALELLAVQADLRVVRRGNAFLITNPDHANALFDEEFDKQRKKIELDRLKNPPPAPQPGGWPLNFPPNVRPVPEFIPGGFPPAMPPKKDM